MASLSKRTQARNERELHDLLTIPGNSQCADCSARNPSWASWNLGVFLCIRCASLHRKLGTHISKVKSLSMDTWTSEQVESMKKNGNTAVNKIYNPKNKKPDTPLDADEIDSAMERFIRKKYQEKSLVDGKPEPPSRSEASQGLGYTAREPSPGPQLPPKKHKFFGFGLRAHSDKKNPRGEPRVDTAFRITSDEHRSPTTRRKDIPDHELQVKLAQLRDMGFNDNEKNLNILKLQGGDIERTIAALVQLGSNEAPRKVTPQPKEEPRSAVPASSSQITPSTASPSTNPWAQTQEPSAGISFTSASFPTPQSTNNPWQSVAPVQSSTGLEQSFQSLQVSKPLFPHSTGGYPAQPQPQQPPRLQTMTPPVMMNNQGYAYTNSPVNLNNTNPFMQPQLATQSTGNNPFLQQSPAQPSFAPSVNPFFEPQGTQINTNHNTMMNPFGLPQQQPTQRQLSNPTQSTFQPNNPFGMQSQQQPGIQQANTFPSMQQHQFSQTQSPPPTLPNFDYGQPQMQTQPQQQYAQQQPQQFVPQYNTQLQYNQQQQGQPLMAQPTGRYTKNDIMALFNMPQQTPQQQSLAAIPEPSEETLNGQQHWHQNISPAPSNNPYGNLAPATTTQRSVTMPASLSNMHSAGGGGSRNPFLTNTSSRQVSNSSVSPSPAQVPQGYPQGARHTSNESVSVNNPSLIDGRHSPDAFASLSARYVR